MIEILKTKTAWLLIALILLVALIGGLQEKKTAELVAHNGHTTNSLLKNKPF